MGCLHARAALRGARGGALLSLVYAAIGMLVIFFVSSSPLSFFISPRFISSILE
jgi:hypothetical protein